MRRLSLLLAILVSFTACKNEEKKDNTPVNIEKETQTSIFELKINALIETDDVFEVFYTDYDNLKYSRKTKISKKVQGKPITQTITVKLPKEVFPTSLRIDVGKTKAQSDISLESVSMTYEDFKLTMNSVEFGSFFRPNKYISYNKKDGLIKCAEIDGKYDPYFDSKPVFKKKLELEAR